MPIYEFECNRCKRRFERLMKIGEEAPVCPACGARQVRKVAAPFRTNAWSAFLDGMEKRANPHKFR